MLISVADLACGLVLGEVAHHIVESVDLLFSTVPGFDGDVSEIKLVPIIISNVGRFRRQLHCWFVDLVLVLQLLDDMLMQR